MKTSAKVLLAALLTTSSVSFAMSLDSATQDQVKQMYVNKTFKSISTAQLNGKTVDNMFTGYLDDKGNMWGKFAHKPTNAPQTDQGTYMVKDDGALCITWQHWMDAKQFCIYTYETDNAYLIVGDNKVFHTAIMKNTFQDGKHI